MNAAVSSPTPNRRIIWTGRVISALVALPLGVSAFMKLKGGPELDEGIAHLGLNRSMVVPLAVLELTCVVIYLIPLTAVVGAILLTGYLGGAICSHWRVGDPFVMPLVFGVAVWLGLYLRDVRLRKLIPLRHERRGDDRWQND